MSDSFEQASRIMDLDRKATANALEASKQSLTNLLHNSDQVVMTIAALENLNDDTLLKLVQADPT